MGQLDEAIRAHLELKRKHGASEEELHADEQEALGPVRREPPAQQAAEPDETSPDLEVEPGAGDPDLYDESPDSFDEPARSYDDLESYDEPLEDLPPEGFHEPLAEPDFDQPAETAGEGVETAEFTPEGLEDTPPLEPAEPLDPIAPAQAGPTDPEGDDTPPRGFDAIEAPTPEDEEEDVLEETPDFLQETPEHDRLWFEQKPPRDFDFDE